MTYYQLWKNGVELLFGPRKFFNQKATDIQLIWEKSFETEREALVSYHQFMDWEAYEED